MDFIAKVWTAFSKRKTLTDIGNRQNTRYESDVIKVLYDVIIKKILTTSSVAKVSLPSDRFAPREHCNLLSALLLLFQDLADVVKALSHGAPTRRYSKVLVHTRATRPCVNRARQRREGVGGGGGGETHSG